MSLPSVICCQKSHCGYVYPSNPAACCPSLEPPSRNAFAFQVTPTSAASHWPRNEFNQILNTFSLGVRLLSRLCRYLQNDQINEQRTKAAHFCFGKEQFYTEISVIKHPLLETYLQEVILCNMLQGRVINHLLCYFGAEGRVQANISRIAFLSLNRLSCERMVMRRRWATAGLEQKLFQPQLAVGRMSNITGLDGEAGGWGMGAVRGGGGGVRMCVV